MFRNKETHPKKGPSRPSQEPGVCQLDHVHEGQRAEIVEVKGDHGANRRLAHLGILVGATVHVLRAAPLGGPILVEVHGGTVAVGRSLARKVLVKVRT